MSISVSEIRKSLSNSITCDEFDLKESDVDDPLYSLESMIESIENQSEYYCCLI